MTPERVTPAGVSGMPPRTAPVVTTGATGGIGSALVRMFPARRDGVVAVGRAASSLDSVCAETGAVAARLELVRPEPLPPSLADLTTVDGLVHAAPGTSTSPRSPSGHRPWCGDALRGGRGIRTHDGCYPIAVFKTAAIGH